MLLFEGFEGEKSSDFLPKFPGIVSSRKVAGLSQSVAPLPPPAHRQSRDIDIFTGSVLAFVPYDPRGVVLLHGSPRHAYLGPARIWWSYYLGLLRCAGANAAILPKMWENFDVLR